MSAITDKILALIRPKNGVAAAARDGETVSTITQALADLIEERTKAQAASDDLLDRREALLLTPNTDTKIKEIDAAVDVHMLTVSRLDAAEPILVAALREAQTDEARVVFEDLQASFVRAVRLFADAGRQMHAMRALMIDIRTAAELAGFQRESPVILPLPHDRVCGSVAGLTQYELDVTINAR